MIVFILTIFYSIAHRTQSIHQHNCKHHQVQNFHHPKVPISFTNYDNHPYNYKSQYRRLKEDYSSKTNPNWIRIIPITEQLEKDLKDSDPKITQHAKQLVGAAIDKFQSMIKVISPVQGNLRIHRRCHKLLKDQRDGSQLGCVNYQKSTDCFLINIPPQHLARDDEFDETTGDWLKEHPGGSGVPNADLILYVTSQDDGFACSPQSSVVAWAGACVRDQFGRPVAGAINICPDTLKGLTKEKWPMFENVVFHEMIHVLVFSQDNMANFVDERGWRVPLTDIIGQDENGIQYVISPNVKRVTREHFGCEDIHGAILEPHGGAGTNGNHWMMQLHGALMGPVVFNNVGYMTAITCALFDDSGHYKTDKNKCVQPWRFGYHAGCNFFFDKCTDAKTGLPSYPQYFCNENYENGCSWDGLSLSSCRAIPNGAIEMGEKYQQSNLNLDVCPFEEAHYYSGDINLCVTAQNPNQRCIRTEFEQNDFRTFNVFDDEMYLLVPNMVRIWERQILFGRCYNVNCNNYDDISQTWQSIQIVVNDKNIINCDREEAFKMKSVEIDGRNAKITCPSVDLYCIGEKPFNCVYGWYNKELKRCVCNVGFTGELCQDIHTTIYSYPPVNEFNPEYTIPGLIANINVKIGIEDLNLLNGNYTMQPPIHGGYWYRQDIVDGDDYGVIWYDVLERVWVLAAARIEDGTQYVSPTAICRSKRSVDAPNIVNECNNGDWKDMNENDLISIDIIECESCDIPPYFEQLRREIFS